MPHRAMAASPIAIRRETESCVYRDSERRARDRATQNVASPWLSRGNNGFSATAIGGHEAVARYLKASPYYVRAAQEAAEAAEAKAKKLVEDTEAAEAMAAQLIREEEAEEKHRLV